MVVTDASAREELHNQWRNKAAVNIAAQLRLVDSWLGSSKDDAAPSVATSAVIDPEYHGEDDLVALTRSQRAGLGAEEGNSHATQTKDIEDLQRLRRQLRLPKNVERKTHDTRPRYSTSGKPSLDNDDSESSSEGRARAVGSRRAGGIKKRSSPSHEGEVRGIKIGDDGSIPTSSVQLPAKRKVSSYLDEILQQKQAKNAKTKKKRKATTVSPGDKDKHLAERTDKMAQTPGDGQNTGDGVANGDIAEWGILKKDLPQPASEDDTAHVSSDLNSTIGNHDIHEPQLGLSKAEAEAERRRRRNKRKKIKLKEKQQHCRTQDSLTG